MAKKKGKKTKAEERRASKRPRTTRSARPRTVGGAALGPHARLSGRRPLVRELMALYAELGRLARATRDEGARARVREQQDALGVHIDELIDRAIREDTEAYREATEAIIAASRRIEEALGDLSLAADAVVGAARVVDAVARVLGAAVGPLPPR